jgi:hypothetical protein
MNASHLKSVLQRILAWENEHQIQEHLNALDKALQEHANNRNSKLLERVEKARSQVSKALLDSRDLSPALKRDISVINAQRFFNELMPAEFEAMLAPLAESPAVARDRVHEEVAKRQRFLEGMAATVQALSSFEVQDDELRPGDSEIEVLLPRLLFEGNLQGLQHELSVLNKILRTFYELNDLSPEPIDVRHISASDPTFFLGIDVSIALDIAKAVKWCIDTISGALSLRRVISEARKTPLVDTSIIDKIESDIAKNLDKQIEAKVLEILTRFSEEQRRNEMRMKTDLALRELYARLERGMEIIPRVLPPPDDADGRFDEKQRANFKTVAFVGNTLEFPKIEGEPLLKISHSKTQEPTEGQK